MNIDVNVKVTKKDPSATGEVAKVRIAIGGTIHQAVLIKPNPSLQGHLELDAVSKHFEDKVHIWGLVGKDLQVWLSTLATAMYNQEVNNV